MIVVTGGAGFIGSVVAWRLHALGAVVGIVDDKEQDARRENLRGLQSADVWTPPEFLRRLQGQGPLPPIEAVLHLGACSSTTETDWDYLRRNNLEYSQAVADWCLPRGVRLIYASSAATYGDGAQGYAVDLQRLEALHPLNLYGRSKHEFDRWMHRRGARAAGLKYFNVYGPHEYHKGEMRSMVLKASEQATAGDGVVRLFRSYRPEYGDGEQTRDFLYVDDAVAMTLWFLEHPEANGLFNLGSGVARTWNDLARAVFAALGREPRIAYIPMPESIRGQYQYETQADLAGLRAAGCDLEPRTLEAGVREYVRDYLQTGARHLGTRQHGAAVGTAGQCAE